MIVAEYNDELVWLRGKFGFREQVGLQSIII